VIEDFEQMGYLGKQIDQLMDPVIEEYQCFFLLAQNINQVSQSSLHNLRVINSEGRSVIAVSLFIKIINGFQSAYLLSLKGLFVEAGIITRSLLESLFLLKILSEDEEFVREYINSDKVNRHRLLTRIAKDETDFFNEIKDKINVDERLELEKEIKDEQIKKLEVWKIAKRAGLDAFYKTAYADLSEDVHSSIRSLEKYVGIDDQGQIQNFITGPQSGSAKKVLYTLLATMLHTLNSVNEIFNLELDKWLIEKETELFKLVG
jgi:hypothetical protein